MRAADKARAGGVGCAADVHVPAANLAPGTTSGTRIDLDGALTIFDAGDAAADFDGDGELTLFDFLAFQIAFGAGCE